MPSAFDSVTWYDALQEFLMHLQATRAPKTVRFYGTQLRQLCHWAGDNEIALQGFSKRHMDRYLTFRSATVSQTTLHHDAVAAKAFMKWCVRNDLLERSLLSDYEIRKAPKPARYMPTHEEIQQLLAALDDFWTTTKNPNVRFLPPVKRQFHRERNRCIILGLLDSSCRIGEMLSLKEEDFRAKEAQITIRESKSREPRAIPVSPGWAASVEDWLKIRKRIMGPVPPEEDENWLFVSEYGTRIDESKFLKSVRRYLRFAQLSDSITLHSLRRYSLNRLAKHNLLAAQQIAGHKSSQTTLLYTKLDPDFVRDMHAQVGTVKDVLVSKRPIRKKLL